MPKSMASSDPLSSPSPSPPPPTRSRLSNKSAAQQLDTSSELSELTDEDVDADKATPPSEEEDDDDGLDDAKGDTLATRPTLKASQRTVHEHWTYKRKRRKDAEQDREIEEDDPEDEEGEEEEEEEEEDEPVMQPRPMEEEEDEEEQPGIRRPVNVVRAPRYRDVHEDDVDDDDERDEDDEDDDVTPRRRRRVARAESLSDSGADDGESEAGQDPEDDVLPQPAATAAAAKVATPDLTEDEDDLAAQAAEGDDVESENDTASEEDDPEAAMDVDEDAPETSAPTVNGAPTPIATAAAPPAPPIVASIMGAAVIDDAASQSASPSPSPPPEDAPDGDAPEPDDIEADAEVEDDAADAETEPDLQHEHRAEALDTLATIELKFALLRERVYVEKMEALAWEEALVKNGSHPELLHLHSELSRRRDKRIELAARRRSYEIANIYKRRRAEESAVWSWWMLARDELQTTMVAETNRKRRKLERDRRAVERPQPAFRLPHFPHEHFQHEIPIPPTLHDIVNSKSQRSTSSSGRRGKDLPAPLRAYPSFSSLSSREITEDLDYLLNHRWPPEPPPSRYDSFAPAPPAVGVVLDMSPYGRPPAPAPAPPPRRRYPPGPSGLQHELDHGSGPFSRPLTPHGAKVNGWVPGSGISRPSEPMFERDEREREDIDMRERDMEYTLHKQQQQQQQQQMHYIIQQPQQQQHTPTRSLPHTRSDPHIGPGQGPQLPPPPTYNSSSGHHHHHVHHHHVHHHHHNSSSAPPPSLPHQPPISPLHPFDGPRHASSRELEPPRAPEIINLPSAPNAPLPPRQWEREREPPSPRHRDRERDRDRDRERERDRDQRDRDRDRDRGRPASGPPPAGPHERIMTPFSAPLAPSAQPRPSRRSFSESVQTPSQPPPPPQPHTPQQGGGGGGGTPHGSPIRSRALPGRMVSPTPSSAPLHSHSQPSTPQQLLLATQHPMQGPGQGSTMSPPRAPRIPTVPASPSAKPMDGERDRDRIVLPLPPPPPPAPSQPPTSGPGMPQPAPTLPPTSAHASHASHRLPLPLNPPTLPSPAQGQGTGPSQPPPSIPVVAGEGV